MDMEAGIEHFGRGIDNGVDLILIIIDPSYESLQLSKKIGELSESIRKPFYYVLNKVTKENQEIRISTFYLKNEEIYCGYMIKENQIIQL